MKTDGMLQSKIRLMDMIESCLNKQLKVKGVYREEQQVLSFIPNRKRKADFFIQFEDDTNLIIQCINQEGTGSACYKFEHYLKEREFDLRSGFNSVIVCSGRGMPDMYLRYMLSRGVVMSEWFETWLNIYLKND